VGQWTHWIFFFDHLLNSEMKQKVERGALSDFWRVEGTGRYPLGVIAGEVARQRNLGAWRGAILVGSCPFPGEGPGVGGERGDIVAGTIGSEWKHLSSRVTESRIRDRIGLGC